MIAKNALGELQAKLKGTTVALFKPVKNPTALKAPSTNISRLSTLNYTSNWGSATLLASIV